MSKITKTFPINLHSPLLDDVINFFPPELTEIISDYSLPSLHLDLKESISSHLKKVYSFFLSEGDVILVCNRNRFLIEQYNKLDQGKLLILLSMTIPDVAVPTVIIGFMVDFIRCVPSISY